MTDERSRADGATIRRLGAAARVMRIAPLDMRQPRFRTAVRGFDKTEVVAFLTEAADDYESALREIDRLRQDLDAQRVAARRASRAREHTCATRW